MSERSSCSSSLLTSAASRGDAQSGGKLGQSGLTPASHTDRTASSDIAFHREPSFTSNTHRCTMSVGCNKFNTPVITFSFCFTSLGIPELPYFRLGWGWVSQKEPLGFPNQGFLQARYPNNIPVKPYTQPFCSHYKG